MARILVIDDDDSVRSLQREILRSAGYEITEAANGVDGSRLFREQPFDLVITDIIMPGKEGLETIQEIRREFGDTKIIAISGGGRSIAAQTVLPIAARLGADEIMDKPFTIGGLLSAVKRLLGTDASMVGRSPVCAA
jgi:CheY-like chemotaxis protein